ncbi:hypothetical protein ACFL1I_01465 [Candidatus Omnitrophota bacterium]
MNKRFRANVEKNLFRIPIFLDKEASDWLYSLSISMKLNGGYKLPKSYIIRSLINAFIKLDINFKKIKTEAELQQRILNRLIALPEELRPKMNPLKNGGNNNLLVANIRMNKNQINFIDKIAGEIRFSGGNKPSRSSILNVFIKIAMVIKYESSGVKFEKDCEERFVQAFKNELSNATGVKTFV